MVLLLSPAASARRDNLDLFVHAVSEFQAVDGQVTLAALLAWLEAEDSFGQGLDVATPSRPNSVTLVTVHLGVKGLEWDVVLIPGVTERKFPTERTRSTWLTVPFAMPGRLRGDARDRPGLARHTPADIAAFLTATKEHERIEGSLRLAHVAWTRARHHLRTGPAALLTEHQGRARPLGAPQATVRALADRGRPRDPWRDRPAKGEPNPYAALDPDLPWPMSHHTPEVARRHDAATPSPVRRRCWPPARPGSTRPTTWWAGPDPGVGRRGGPAGRGGDRDLVAGDRRTPAVEPVRDRRHPAA